MIYLGAYTQGTVLPYAVRFHNDLGAAEDPSGPGAKLRVPAGTWGAQTAPAKQDATTGLFGGSVDTAGFAVGLYLLHVYGTVTTAKTVGTVLSFQVLSNVLSDIATGVVGIAALVDTEVAAILAAVDTEVAAIKAKTDTIGALAVTISSPVATSSDITLYGGDDYKAAHSRAVTVLVDDDTHLLGLDDPLAVVRIKCSQATWTAVSAVSTDTGYTVTFELTAAQTAAITHNRQNYEVEAVLADGDVVTLATGTLISVRDIL